MLYLQTFGERKLIVGWRCVALYIQTWRINVGWWRGVLYFQTWGIKCWMASWCVIRPTPKRLNVGWRSWRLYIETWIIKCPNFWKNQRLKNVWRYYRKFFFFFPNEVTTKGSKCLIYLLLMNVSTAVCCFYVLHIKSSLPVFSSRCVSISPYWASWRNTILRKNYHKSPSSFFSHGRKRYAISIWLLLLVGFSEIPF